MFQVTQYGKEIGEGTLTECVEHIAAALSQFHPEQVTVWQGIEAGYQLSRV